MTVVFRRFGAADAPAVRALHELALRQSGGFIESPQARLWDRDLDAIETIYLRTGGEFLVGVAGGSVVAMGGLLLPAAGVAKIKRMRVHPEYQRRGHGRELLRQLEQHARDAGAQVIVLDTSIPLAAACALYRSNGYHETGRGIEGGVEMIYMEKRLA